MKHLLMDFFFNFYLVGSGSIRKYFFLRDPFFAIFFPHETLTMSMMYN